MVAARALAHPVIPKAYAGRPMHAQLTPIRTVRARIGHTRICHSDHHRQIIAVSPWYGTPGRAAAATVSYHSRTQPPYVQPRHQRRFIATTAAAQARSASSARARTRRPGAAPAQALRDRSWFPLGHPLGKERKRHRLEAALLPIEDARRFIHSIGFHREHAHVRETPRHETPAPFAA